MKRGVWTALVVALLALFGGYYGLAKELDSTIRVAQTQAVDLCEDRTPPGANRVSFCQCYGEVMYEEYQFWTGPLRILNPPEARYRAAISQKCNERLGGS